MYLSNASYLLPDTPLRHNPNGTFINHITMEHVLFRAIWLLCLVIVISSFMCLRLYFRRKASMQSNE